MSNEAAFDRVDPAGRSDGGPVAFRATILHFTGDPGDDLEPAPDTMELLPDGVLVVDGGRVVSVVPFTSDIPHRTVDYSGKLIVPGFVDTHVHYVQMDAIASYGDRILQWLDEYILPAESRFDDFDHASTVAGFFLDTLLAGGTTTAMVWPTTPRESVDAFFTQAQARRLRMISGKVVQDRSAYGGNQNDPSVSAAEETTRSLIARWHGVDRLLYAVTPRFAPTCGPEMLGMCGRLLDEWETRGDPLWFQTHLSENLEEECVVRKGFQTGTYAEVYERHRLFRERAVFAHCNEIGHGDRALMAAGGASIAHCPTSNFFLGSGTFNLWEARKAGIRVGLGTDCGAGTRYDLLSTMGAAYQAQAMRARDYVPPERLPPMTVQGGPIEPVAGRCAKHDPDWSNPYPPLTAWQAFYLATRGGAAALRLDLPGTVVDGSGVRRLRPGIGWFAPGNEADFVVLDPAATPVLKRRIEAVEPEGRSLLKAWHEKLFALITLGDDRAVHATYVLGGLV